jgi:hypothetical protein
MGYLRRFIMAENNEIVLQKSSAPIPMGYENYLDEARFAQVSRIATAFAASDLVPDRFKNKHANCFIAIQLGMRLGIDPLMALQNLYVVNGNPGISTQMMISLANRCGVFKGPVEFEELGSGDSLAVCASATLSASGKLVKKTVTLAQAKEAGWTKNPIWRSQTSQMLSYRAASQLIRLYAPEAILGMTSVEEWEDLGDNVSQRVQPAKENLTASILSSLPAQESQAEETPKKRGRSAKAATEMPTTAVIEDENFAHSREEIDV